MFAQITPQNRRFAPGLALVAIGLLLLVGQLVHTAWMASLVLLMLAIVFVAFGVYTRMFGWMIPGGILAGLAVGIFLEQSLPLLSAEARGGIILLSLAAGFAGIIPLCAAFARRVMLWPLFPAGALALIGAAVLIGGEALQLLSALNLAWPLALMALGTYLLVRRSRA